MTKVTPLSVTKDAKIPALLVSDARFSVVTLKKYEIVPTSSVMGAIFWLYQSDKTFKELWLDTEIIWDHANATAKSITYSDGRFLCEFLDQWMPASKLDLIRIITKNPAHLLFAKNCLKDKYNLSFNLPPNQGKPWAQVFKKE